LNPYLGKDAIAPFIQNESLGVFILCLTSNPSSAELQKLEINGQFLYLKVAETVVKWNSHDNCGLVVGATHGTELETIRETAAKLPFLIPGIGAQGGDLETAVMAGTDEQGEMAIINSSRGIIYASSNRDYSEAARLSALDLRNKINIIREKKGQSSL
jgi:orotidine-5'-phosphate decarboxylase